MGRPKTIKGYKKDLTQLIRDKVLKRDKSRCQKCGKKVAGKNAHLSHVIPKSHSTRLRWDVKNLKIFCMRHHIYWFHKNPVEAGLWFKDKFPKRWEYLQEHKHKTVRWRKHHYQDMIKEFKENGEIDWSNYE